MEESKREKMGCVRGFFRIMWEDFTRETTSAYQGLISAILGLIKLGFPLLLSLGIAWLIFAVVNYLLKLMKLKPFILSQTEYILIAFIIIVISYLGTWHERKENPEYVKLLFIDHAWFSKKAFDKLRECSDSIENSLIRDSMSPGMSAILVVEKRRVYWIRPEHKQDNSSSRWAIVNINEFGIWIGEKIEGGHTKSGFAVISEPSWLITWDKVVRFTVGNDDFASWQLARIRYTEKYGSG